MATIPASLATALRNRSQSLTAFALHVIALQIAGGLGLFVKWLFLDQTLAFLVISRFLGRIGPDQLTLIEKAYFFRLDALLHLLLIPITIALIAALLRPTLAFLLVAVACVALTLFHFTALQSIGSVGQFLTLDLLRDSIAFGMDNPDQINEYISNSASVKLLAIIASSLSFATLAYFAARRRPMRSVVLVAQTVCATACVGAVLLWLIAANERFATFPQRFPTSGIQLSTLLNRNVSALRHLTKEQLRSSYLHLANSGACPTNERFNGSEVGSDVLIFVMETGPQRSFALANSRGELATTSALAHQSFIGHQHYSTYPYTSDATFSIYTGRYPLNRRNMVASEDADFSSTLMQKLRAKGYSINFYVPFGDTFEPDTQMFSRLGATKTFLPNESSMNSPATRSRVERALKAIPADVPAQQPPSQDKLKNKLDRDLSALDELIADITRMKSGNKRFLSVFLPQIGHGPWLDVRGESSVVARGGSLMAIQDGWLGEIIAALEQHDQLRSTIVVVTADHGIRTRVEDPDFPGGTLSDYTFQVPLLIFAPHATATTVSVDRLTSHIDIMPTLAALLGEDLGGGSQGMPIWCDAIGSRTTFFFAGEYLGADGFHRDGQFTMHEVLTNAVYRNSRMAFGPDDTVAEPEAEASRAMLREMSSITSAWNGP